MTAEGRLVGTWRLRGWTSTLDDGSVVHPFGESPEGILVYTADGTMITTIGMPDRPQISGGDILGGPDDELVAMASTFIAYAGTYRLDGDDVVHEVEMSFFPDWVGTQQRRRVEMSPDGRELTLSSNPMTVRGRVSSQRLIWERMRE